MYSELEIAYYIINMQYKLLIHYYYYNFVPFYKR